MKGNGSRYAAIPLKIHERIRELRKEKGITQETLARAVGVTNQAVSKWEQGKCCPDIQYLPELADYFSVSIDDLFGHGREERPAERSTGCGSARRSGARPASVSSPTAKAAGYCFPALTGSGTSPPKKSLPGIAQRLAALSDINVLKTLCALCVLVLRGCGRRRVLRSHRRRRAAHAGRKYRRR